MRFRRDLGLPAVALMLMLMVGPAGPAQAQAARLKVVATFSINGDFVRNVAVDAVDLTVLVGPDGDAHTYEPTPADTAALANANLIIENGLHFEHWLDDLYEASRSQAPRVAITDGITPLIWTDEIFELPTEGEAHEHEDEGEFDPHMWHDVAKAMAMVENTRDALALVDPANAAGYQTNAARYLAELRELDSWIVAQVQQVPASSRKIVTSHDSMQYFSQRYGFQVIGAAIPSLGTEGAEPNAATVANLIDKIRAAGVPAVFTENISNPRLIERIASETNVRIGDPLYTDALGPPNSAGATYVLMLRHNTNAIVSALK